MFGNFAKIGRAGGASPIWQNFQTSRVHHACNLSLPSTVHHACNLSLCDLPGNGLKTVALSLNAILTMIIAIM